MNGWSKEQICREMLISRTALTSCMWEIFRQERVKSRRELAAKLGWKKEQPLNKFEQRRVVALERDERVEPLLAAGLGYDEIAKRTGMSRFNVANAARRIYRRRGIAPVEGRTGSGKGQRMKGLAQWQMTNDEIRMTNERTGRLV
jgi:hypothetical protein